MPPHVGVGGKEGLPSLLTVTWGQPNFHGIVYVSDTHGPKITCLKIRPLTTNPSSSP